MWFLLFQILLLLFLAALLGAALMYWWMSSRYEDVTEIHDELMAQIGGGALHADAATREDLDHGVASLTSRVDNIRMPDLAPVMTHLANIERRIDNIRIPEVDITPIARRLEALDIFHDRFARLDNAVTAMSSHVGQLYNADLSPVEERIGLLEAELRALELPDADTRHIEAQLDRIEAEIRAIDTGVSEVDLGPVHSAIATLGLSVDEIKTRGGDGDSVKRSLEMMDNKLAMIAGQIHDDRRAANENVGSRLSAIQATLNGLQPPDQEPILDLLTSLESAIAGMTPPTSELTQLNGRLERIETQASALDPISSRMSILETAIADVATLMARLENANLGPVETRLARIEQLAERIDRARDLASESVANAALDLSQQIASLPLPNVDALQTRLSSLDRSIQTLRLPEPDLRPIQSMLMGLERAVGDLSRGSQDLRPLNDALSALETSVSSMRGDLRGLQALGSIENAVLEAVNIIEGRIDLGAVENRLTAIEYGLTAVHQMLRSRGEASPARGADAFQAKPSTFYQSSPSASESSRDFRTTTSFRTASARQPTPPLQRPPLERDSLAGVRRPDDKANLLREPAFGEPDDLEEIAGVGPMLNQLLKDIGVFYFWQIADWGPEEVEWVDSKLLHFRGRIEREDWVGQARDLAQRPGAATRPAG